MPTRGGLHLAIDRIRSVDGTALQIFTRNQRRRSVPPIGAEEARLFAEAWRSWGDHPVVAHDSYLINLASPDRQIRNRSRRALVEELRRSAALGIELVE
jgi:deoxyribonuclease-4